jgi:prepilin-type N-terminal cleavage/methylation domain-containing protein
MRQRGFTLVEMLVVMVLLGLMTSLALPAMQRWHDAVQVRARAAAIVETLRAAAFAAGANRREIVLDERCCGSPEVGTAPVGATAAAVETRPPTAAEVPAGGPEPTRVQIPLPANWQVVRVTTARFLANGLCRAGDIQLLTERGEPLQVVVRGPVCTVELVTGRDPS